MDEGPDRAERLWDVLVKLSVPGVIVCVSSLVLHEVRLSVIESNRFTDEDSFALETRILSNVPPPWLREDLNEIKVMLRDYDLRFSGIEGRLIRLESKQQ